MKQQLRGKNKPENKIEDSPLRGDDDFQEFEKLMAAMMQFNRPEELTKKAISERIQKNKKDKSGSQ